MVTFLATFWWCIFSHFHQYYKFQNKVCCRYFNISKVVWYRHFGLSHRCRLCHFLFWQPFWLLFKLLGDFINLLVTLILNRDNHLVNTFRLVNKTFGQFCKIQFFWWKKKEITNQHLLKYQILFILKAIWWSKFQSMFKCGSFFQHQG